MPIEGDMLGKAFAAIRIAYAHIVYWLVGDSPEIHHWHLAVNWERLGNWRRSIRHCEKYLSYEPSDYIKMILGYCHANLGNWREAAAAYRSHSNILGNPEVALALAEAELASGNEDKAREIVAIVEVNQESLSQSTLVPLDFLRKQLEERMDVDDSRSRERVHEYDES